MIATRILLLVGACLPLLFACAPQPAAPVTKTLHFMGGYKPQANLPFVGVYVAQERGYFADEHLDVKISHSAGQGEHLKLTLQGAVDVTTAAADSIITRRAEGLPVVGFALLGQRSDRAFAVLASSDIHSVKDWEGHTVGYKVIRTPDYLAMLEANGVDPARLTEVPVGFDPRLLAAGKVDVYPVFESNEPGLLEDLGVPVRLFRPTDVGVPGLGLTYMTRQELVDKDPDLLARFLRASLRGIAFAREHQEEAVDIIMKYAPNEDRAHQLSMLRVELDMANGPVTEQHGIGWSTTEQWQALHDSLLAYGGITTSVDVSTVFTDRILREAYRNPEALKP